MCRWLPWSRRAIRAERELHRTRARLQDIHQDWTPLAHNLNRIDHEIQENEWTLTARKIFSGGAR